MDGRCFGNPFFENIFNFKIMENEAEINLFFWTSTAIILLSAFGIFLMILIYRFRMYYIYRKESDTLQKVTLNIKRHEIQRLASELHDSISGDLTAVQNFIRFYKSLKDLNGRGLKNITSRINHIQAELKQIPTDKGNKIQIHLKR